MDSKNICLSKKTLLFIIMLFSFSLLLTLVIKISFLATSNSSIIQTKAAINQNPSCYFSNLYECRGAYQTGECLKGSCRLCGKSNKYACDTSAIDREISNIIRSEKISYQSYNMEKNDFDKLIRQRALLNLSNIDSFDKYFPFNSEAKKTANYFDVFTKLKNQFLIIPLDNNYSVDSSTKIVLLKKIIEDFGIIDNNNLRLPAIEKALKNVNVTVVIDRDSSVNFVNIDRLNYSLVEIWKMIIGKTTVSGDDNIAHEFNHLINQKRPVNGANTIEEIWGGIPPFQNENMQDKYMSSIDFFNNCLYPFPHNGGNYYLYTPGEFFSTTGARFIADRNYFLQPDFSQANNICMKMEFRDANPNYKDQIKIN